MKVMDGKQHPDDPTLTTRDVMARIGVKDPQKVYDLIPHKLSAVNIGTDRRATWRFRPSAVEAYLLSRSVGPLEAPPPVVLPPAPRHFLRRSVAPSHG